MFSLPCQDPSVEFFPYRLSDFGRVDNRFSRIGTGDLLEHLEIKNFKMLLFDVHSSDSAPSGQQELAGKVRHAKWVAARWTSSSAMSVVKARRIRRLAEVKAAAPTTISASCSS